MTVIKIELIDPKARILLEGLAKMNLIKIQDTELIQTDFSALVSKLRSKASDAPSFEEITQEVESVRAERKKLND